MQLFEKYTLGQSTLKNRMVMAPMTRSRATRDHTPTSIMATYYQQRAGAGMIITEGTSPSPNGTGYPRIPGIYHPDQVDAWKEITEAVHDREGKIFIQLMHTGRVSHPLNMPADAQVLAPSAIPPANTKMYTDQEGELEIPEPRAMSLTQIGETIEEYVNAARNAIAAGFDGIELHGANGYLIEQFIYPGSNQRNDTYGGSIENRCRFALEVARQTSTAIGRNRVGIRLSPYGAFNDIQPYDTLHETYSYLTKQLSGLGLVYIHLVDHSSMGAPDVPQRLKDTIREIFSGTLILSGGYDKERAERDLEADRGDLIAFGKPFLANPDLPERFRQDAPLNAPDFSTFYTPGEKGYTDYPTL